MGSVRAAARPLEHLRDRFGNLLGISEFGMVDNQRVHPYSSFLGI